MSKNRVFHVSELVLVRRHERDWQFVEGDVCVLNSGGPVMTVEEVLGNGDRKCKYFDGKQVQYATFPSPCLRPPFEMRILMGDKVNG